VDRAILCYQELNLRAQNVFALFAHPLFTKQVYLPILPSKKKGI